MPLSNDLINRAGTAVSNPSSPSAEFTKAIKVPQPPPHPEHPQQQPHSGRGAPAQSTPPPPPQSIQPQQPHSGRGGSPQPAPTEALKQAQSLSDNWDKWGMHNAKGDPFDNPPASLPKDAQDTLKFFGDNTTLYNAIIADNGGKSGDPLTKAAVDRFIKDGTGDAKQVNSDKSAWDSVSGLSDKQKADLSAPLDAAKALVENWHAWGFAAGKPADASTADLPQQAKDALKTLDTPAMQKALSADQDDSGGKATSKITRERVQKFIDRATDDAKAGASSYSDFMKNNSGASDPTKALAQSAAIVRGNQTLFSAASTDPNRLVDGSLRSGDLANVAGSKDMSSTLTDAANLWSHSGMFSQLDTGGLDLATNNADGIANGGNITDWVSKQLPSITGSQLGGMLSDAANWDMAAGVDTSKLGPDVFANPGKYSAEQKDAVLQQLTDLQGKVQAGNDGGEWAGAVNNIDGLGNRGRGSVNPDPNQVKGDIAAKIAQLSADPDVQKYQSDNRGTSLQKLVQADPAFNSSLQNFFKGDLQNGNTVKEALNTKDENGNKVTPEQGLQSFVQTADTLNLAMGSDGKPAPALDLQKIVQASGQQGALQQAYSDDILSGKSLQGDLDNGVDMGSAIQKFTSDAANFGSVLPSDFVAQNAQKLQTTFSDTVSSELTNTGTIDDLTKAFGNSSGNLDTTKVTDAINQAIAVDPKIAIDANGNKIKPDQIVGAVNTLFSDIRNGTKLQDALAKLAKQQDSANPAIRPPQGIPADAYNKGVMHIIGAVMNTGVLIGKGVENSGSGSGTAAASVVSSGLQVVGGIMEGGSKYAKSSIPDTFSSNELKNFESAGKAIGGAGGIIGGALGIFGGVQSLQAGDKAGAGVGLATGITGTWSGISSAVEGGLGIAETALEGVTLGDTALGSAIGAAIPAVAATSATLGIVGGVTIVLGLAGLGIYEAVKGAQRVDDFTGQIQPALSQYGITGGTQPSTSPPVDPAPPGEA